VDEARLRGHMSIRAGQKYSASRLDDDVRTLYESGLVEDIRFFAEDVTGGVKVIAEVTTRGKIVAVGFTGNEKFTDRKLASVTKLKAGGVMSDEAILTARRNILDQYRGYGYADVTVTHRLQPSKGAPGSSDLIFIVDEGSRSEVRKIRFEGNNSIASHKLRNEMKTKQIVITCLPYLADALEGEIVALGYQVIKKVTSLHIHLKQEKKCLYLV